MRSLTFACVAAVLFISGCGGSYSVTRTSAKAPAQIRSASFSTQSGNSTEVTGYISEALASYGVATTSLATTPGVKSSEVDAIVTYVDVWRWDLVMYLKSIAISLYNAKTGELLVTGRWRDSFLHTFYRGDSVSTDLIKQMFEKLELNQKGDVATAPSIAVGNPSTPLAVTSSPAIPANKAKGMQVSRNEYEAREQARALQCKALEILGVEGVGSSREEIVFDCGSGRKLTIVCRSGLGCS